MYILTVFEVLVLLLRLQYCFVSFCIEHKLGECKIGQPLVAPTSLSVLFLVLALCTVMSYIVEINWNLRSVFTLPSAATLCLKCNAEKPLGFSAS
jgi:hypothetical protein